MFQKFKSSSEASAIWNSELQYEGNVYNEIIICEK